MGDITLYNNLFQFLHFFWRMNQNKKEYSTIDKHLCLRSRSVPADYFCSLLTHYPGFHHLTHVSWGHKQGKKKERNLFSHFWWSLSFHSAPHLQYLQTLHLCSSSKLLLDLYNPLVRTFLVTGSKKFSHKYNVVKNENWSSRLSRDSFLKTMHLT